MGAPDRREEIIIPEGPFYGPQESLAGTLPSGEVVEEWVYTRGEIELYIWFWGEDPAIRDGWRVIDFVEYPASAVF
jgi:hypothetical protein